MHALRFRLGRFGRDTEGQLSIEACLMIPLIMWIYVATFTYFETFRADSTNVKAAYAVGDMLSRETEAVGEQYLEGMNTIFAHMTYSRFPTWLRVTSVSFDSIDDKLVLNWSHATGGKTALTAETLAEIVASVPKLNGGDSVIVVETYMRYEPGFRVGLDPFTFRNVVVTRPRFAPQLIWTDA